MLELQTAIDVLMTEAATTPLKGPVRPWLEADALPTPSWRSGFLMPELVLSYILYRQSQGPERELCAPLVRCLPLLEPDDADPLVKALLDGFQKAGADVRDKFVLMPVAALASPGLMLTAIGPLILRWARRRRGRLASFALDALGAAALHRPDPAGAIFALGTLYPILRDAQRRTLAETAWGHLEAVSQARGMGIGALIDQSTPTLGIKAGQWRLSERAPVVEATPRSPRDLSWSVEGQPVDAPPTTLGSAGHRARIKSLSDHAEAVFDGLVQRLQDAAVAGRLWSAGGFIAHLLKHPLLSCPVRRMVWCALDGRGQLVGTFRPRDDGALVDVDDNLFTTPHTWVRPAHPARLPPELVGRWQAHLEYHGLDAPFDQLERPAHACPPDLQRALVDMRLEGTRWRDIHERPEAFAGGPWAAILRMGWHVGWVRTVPGPSGPIDVVVRTSEDIGDVEWLYFMPYKAGAITHNDFPSPRRPDGRIMIPLGQVPPAIYAEIVEDVTGMFEAISGDGEAASGRTGPDDEAAEVVAPPPRLRPPLQSSQS